MKFFTRELYNKYQPLYRVQKGLKPVENEKEKKEWREVRNKYKQHLISIKPSLPKKMQEFSEITLHDAIIKSIAKPTQEKLALEIDGSGCCWGPIGQFTLKFKGVKEAQYNEDTIIGDDWLYEEVHLSDVGRFDYRILLGRGEFRVVAEDVEFIIRESGNKQKEELIRKFLEERKKE